MIWVQLPIAPPCAPIPPPPLTKETNIWESTQNDHNCFCTGMTSLHSFSTSPHTKLFGVKETFGQIQPEWFWPVPKQHFFKQTVPLNFVPNSNGKVRIYIQNPQVQDMGAFPVSTSRFHSWPPGKMDPEWAPRADQKRAVSSQESIRENVFISFLLTFFLQNFSGF